MQEQCMKNNYSVRVEDYVLSQKPWLYTTPKPLT